ncbi:MAG: hypothetical protein ACI8RZ_003137 [Myxococcota bacterium]|jgi:hypothetical protein
MLQTLAILAGLTVLFGTIAALSRSTGGGIGARRDVGVIANDWDLVAATHVAQAAPNFGPPPPSVIVVDFTTRNRVQLSREDLDG